jgi:nickel-dependent lactate racemase
MQVDLAYGRRGLRVEVPDGATVVAPADPPPLADEAGAVAAALRAPTTGPSLAQLLSRGDGQVVVVFPDLTRPMPNRTVLPPLLAELEAAGAGPDRVTLLCATGTHRQASPAEMAELVGPEVVARYRIVDHAADDGAHVMVGRVDGVPVLLERTYAAAAVRIVTGFVEPHFFAGFSGGPKAVCPGLAATETILEAHATARIADPRATWTVTEGNPVHDFVRAATALCPPDLALDVAIDRRRRLTAVFCAPLPEGHRAACAFVTRHAVVPVDGPFEVVLTGNGGHPLDRNLYQAVKGMAAAERVVADGGTVVVAAPCGDGVPGGSAFARLLAEATGPAELVDPRAPGEPDRWQTQVLGRVLSKAQVQLFSPGLGDEEVRAAHLVPVADPGRAVAGALARNGPGARLCVLPDGPLSVARLS